MIDLVRLLSRARYREPGEYRVVLQVRGPNPLMVMRELRQTTGKPLVEVKKIMDDTPAIVVEDLSEASAQAVADRLKRAGARALAAPMEISQ